MATAQTGLIAKSLILLFGGLISIASAGGLLYFHPSASLWALGMVIGFLIVLYAPNS